ncbi:hypothetical protein BJI67_16300 (plasmid) [Acidihalobacter aeolianus]|uniref:Uncharacterized protein n=1 Tax=Acidihalobacter aeolianus TaxID=2792603 RepID=A0A1D8KCX0_9GAMM|nr:hypothetical protein BJI67_16300 [Acidihalobacter aeolianus]
MNVIPLDKSLRCAWQPHLDELPLWIREDAYSYTLERTRQSGQTALEDGIQTLANYKTMPLWIFNTEKARTSALEAHTQYGPGGLLLLSRRRLMEVKPQVAILHADTSHQHRACLMRHLSELHAEKPIGKIYCTYSASPQVSEWARNNGVCLEQASDYTLLLAPWDPEGGVVLSRHVADHGNRDRDA